jgi:hypothetical protein
VVCYGNSIEEIVSITDIDHDLLRFRVLPANYQIAALNMIVLVSLGDHGRFLYHHGLAGGLIHFPIATLLAYLYGKLNDKKLIRAW